ncbi:MAG: hypothetical protein V3T58_00250 [Candidatus Hydrothermarchaeales archaeon]
MDIVTDRLGRDIRLTEERWSYIIRHHPEMTNLKREFRSTVSEPDLVVRSVYNPEVVLYYRYFKIIFDGKYLVGVIKLSTDSFVLTGYVADRIKEGEVLWKKD